MWKAFCLESSKNTLMIPKILLSVIMLFDNYGTLFSWKGQVCKFHVKNAISQPTVLLSLIYSVIILNNWSFVILLYYDGRQRRTLEYLLPRSRPANTCHCLHFGLLFVFNTFHSSSPLSRLQITLFIQLDTCHFEKPLLVKRFLDKIWNHKQFTPWIRLPHILKQHIFYNL